MIAHFRENFTRLCDLTLYDTGSKWQMESGRTICATTKISREGISPTLMLRQLLMTLITGAPPKHVMLSRRSAAKQLKLRRCSFAPRSAPWFSILVSRVLRRAPLRPRSARLQLRRLLRNSQCLCGFKNRRRSRSEGTPISLLPVGEGGAAAPDEGTGEGRLSTRGACRDGAKRG